MSRKTKALILRVICLFLAIIGFFFMRLYDNEESKSIVGNIELMEKQGRVADANVVNGILLLEVTGYDCRFATDALEQIDYEALVGKRVYFSIRKEDAIYVENLSAQIVFHTLRTDSETIIPYDLNRSIFLHTTREINEMKKLALFMVLMLISIALLGISMFLHNPFKSKQRVEWGIPTDVTDNNSNRDEECIHNKQTGNSNMIQYTFMKKDIIKRITAVVLSQSLVPLIIGLVLLAISACCFLLGIWVDNEALMYGDFLLFVSLPMFFTCGVLFFKYKKAVERSFNENSDGEKVNYKLEKLNQQYVFTVLTKNKCMKFSENEIKRVCKMKNYVIVKLKSDVVMIYPKNGEILKLFGKQ